MCRNFIIQILFCISITGVIAADTTSLTVVATGECHAMLYPCDCEIEPGGGFPQRAALLDSLRVKQSVLLVDCGGFAGGGPYDIYTEGRYNDSLRTLAAVRAMALMGYDAVAIGDDDLRFGASWLMENAGISGLPLVCANCRLTDGRLLAQPYVIVGKNGFTCAVTSVLTGESLEPPDTGVVIVEPITALKKILPHLDSIADIRVILAHVGEEMSRAIADSFPSCAVVVNGHRKISTSPVEISNGRALMNFGFQGKKMSYLNLTGKNAMIPAGAGGWLTVGPGLDANQQISMTIDSALSTKKPSPVTFDLYIMAECPYGLQAIADLLPLVSSFPGASLNLWFIGDVDSSGKLKSLHGETEIAEEKLWLAVQQVFPSFFFDFCMLKATTNLTAQDIVSQMKLDTVKLLQWVDTYGETAIRMHFYRSARLSVNACPTLFRDNSVWPYPISRLRIARLLCSDDGTHHNVCDSLPECFDSGDCRKPGYHSECRGEEGRGRCEFTRAAPFDFIVLRPDTSFFNYEEDPAVHTTRRLFPSARIRFVNYYTPEGRGLARRIRPAALPAYLFEKGVMLDQNYEQVKNGLVRAGEWLTFRDGLMKKRFFPDRPAKKGVLFLVDPLLPDVERVLSTISAIRIRFPHVQVLPLIYIKPGAKEVDAREILRQEEASRWLSPVSKDRKNSPGRILEGLWNQLSPLEIREPFEVLINNRELITVRSYEDLESLPILYYR